MYGRMLDKRDPPTRDDMLAHCGRAAGWFDTLDLFLRTEGETDTEIKFPYGNQYGWGIKHSKKGKLLCNLFPETGAFTVMLRLSDRQFASAYGGLLEYSRDIIDHKYPCGSGGWIHYRVQEEEQLEDIRTLLRLKLGR